MSEGASSKKDSGEIMKTTLCVLASLGLVACFNEQDLGSDQGTGGAAGSGVGGSAGSGVGGNAGQTSGGAGGASGGSGGVGASGGTGATGGSSGASSCAPGVAAAIEIAGSQTVPYGIAIDQNNAYWVTQGAALENSYVGKVDKNGGTVTKLLTRADDYDALWQPVSVAVAGGNVYWTTTAANTAANTIDSRVWKMPIAGGAHGSVAQGFAIDSSTPGLLVADATNVYALVQTPGPGGFPGEPPTKVVTIPVAGGASSVLDLSPASATNWDSGLAIDSTNLYFARRSIGLGSVSSWKLGSGSGSTATVATANDPVYGPAVDATNAYWAEVHLNQTFDYAVKIQTAPKAGGGVITLATMSGTVLPTALAVDQTHVYWVNFESKELCGSIMRVAKTGGTPEVFASDQDLPIALTLDAQTVYWTNRSGGKNGQVMKASK